MNLVQQSDIKIINRDKLFHNKFRFKATFIVVGARFLSVDSTYDSMVEKIDHMKNKFFGFNEHTIEIKHELANIDWQEIQYITDWLATLNKTEVKLTFAYNKKVTIFFNDANVLSTLKSTSVVEVEEANIVIPPNTKWLTKPLYKYRVYFREQRIDDLGIKENLTTFLNSYPSIKPSKTTQLWLNSSSKMRLWFNRYCKSSYYLEYNEPKYLLVMKLKFNSLMGKEFKLEKKPK